MLVSRKNTTQLETLKETQKIYESKLNSNEIYDNLYSELSSKISVTFDANSGTGTMLPQVTAIGTQQLLKPNTFTKDGYTFIGWNTVANGSGTNYSDEASFIATGNITLYAQWEEIQE